MADRTRGAHKFRIAGKEVPEDAYRRHLDVGQRGIAAASERNRLREGLRDVLDAKLAGRIDAAEADTRLLDLLEASDG